MQRLKLLLFPCMLLLVAALLFLTTARATHATVPAKCGAWNVVSSPNGGKNSVLVGVSAVSASDVWAVGSSGSGKQQQPLIEHWDGTQWSLVPAAMPGSPAALSGVTAIASNDVWAAGTKNLTSGSSTPLFEHWDGQHWTIFAGGAAGSASFISGVTAVASNDVWAVGTYNNTSNQSTSLTLVVHWDGKQWKGVISPNTQQPTNALSSVTAVSANDIWAVGESAGPRTKSLIEHWDGSHWNIVKSPNTTVFNSLSGVAATASNNVWAVGSAEKIGQNPRDYTLTEQWNGTIWQVVRSSNPLAYSILTSVTTDVSNTLWAVGFASKGNGVPNQTLIEQWNGSAWGVVASPNVGSSNNELLGVAHVPGTSQQVWAVGQYNSQNGNQTLIESYCS